MHTKLTIAAGILALLMPVSALAYFSPDQFDSTANQNLQQPPPYARESASVVQTRQQAIGAQRDAAQAKLHGAAPEDDFVPTMVSKSSCLSDECQYELRQQRMDAAQHQAGPTIIIGGNGGTAVYDGNGNVLHSGAPLITASGPGTTLALVALALSLLGTVAYMWHRSRLTAYVSL